MVIATDLHCTTTVVTIPVHISCPETRPHGLFGIHASGCSNITLCVIAPLDSAVAPDINTPRFQARRAHTELTDAADGFPCVGDLRPLHSSAVRSHRPSQTSSSHSETTA